MTAERSDQDDGLGLEREQPVEGILKAQREVNETLVLSTLRAQEQVEAYEEAMAAMRETEQELRATAARREELLGIVGHDLRQPLTVISMAGQRMLLRGGLADRDIEMLGLIQRHAARMHRMILQVLDVTKTRVVGRLVLKAGPADLGVVCRQVAEGLQLQTERQVSCRLEGALDGVWDTDRVTEALENLVSNANQYATPGTDILLGATGTGAEVVVEVSNQGAPIPPDLRATMFDAFRRGDPDHPGAPGSLGLGLYIAREIAHAHGGTLDVSCAEGTTTFSLRLPRR